MEKFSFKRPTQMKNRMERYKRNMREQFYFSQWRNPSSEIHVFVSYADSYPPKVLTTVCNILPPMLGHHQQFLKLDCYDSSSCFLCIISGLRRLNILTASVVAISVTSACVMSFSCQVLECCGASSTAEANKPCLYLLL